MAYELQLNAGVTGTDQLASLESTIQQIAKAAGVSEGSLRLFNLILKDSAAEGTKLDKTLGDLSKQEGQVGVEVAKIAGLLRTQIQATKELGSTEGQRSAQQQRAFEKEEAGWRAIQGAHERALKINAQHGQSNEQLAASIKNWIQNPLQAAGQAAESFVLQYGAIGVAAVGASAGLAVAGGWLLKNAADTAAYAQEMTNLALRTGLSTTEAQLFSRASEVVGVNAGALTTAMRTLSRGMSENSDEGKLQKRVLAELGMGAEAAFKPMGQLIPDIFRKLSEVGNVLERDRMIITLFGRSGLELVPLIGHLEELEKRVKASGVVMDEEGIRKAKLYGEELTLLGNQWEALKHTMANAVIGTISIVTVSRAGQTMSAANAVQGALRDAVLQGAFGGAPSPTDVEMHETAGYGYGTSMSRAAHGAEARSAVHNQTALDAVLDANQDPKKRLQEQIKEQEAKLVSAENKVRGAKLGDEAGRAAALEEVRTILAKTNALREQEKAIGQKNAAVDAWDHKAAEAEARELSGQDKIKAAYAENLRLIAEQAKQKEFHSKAEVARAEADARRIRDANQAVYDQQLKQAQATAERETASTIYKADRRQADLEATWNRRLMLAADKIHEPEQTATGPEIPQQLPQSPQAGEPALPPTASPSIPLPTIEAPPQKTGIDDNTLKLIDNTLATQANTKAIQEMRSPDAVLNSLPRFAQGGVTSGPSIAGEAGPELIIPLKGAASYLQAGDSSFSDAMSGAKLPGVLGKLKEFIDRQSEGQAAYTGGTPMGNLADMFQIPTSKTELALSLAAMLPLGKLAGPLGKIAGRAGKALRAGEGAAGEIAGAEATAKTSLQARINARDTLYHSTTRENFYGILQAGEIRPAFDSESVSVGRAPGPIGRGGVTLVLDPQMVPQSRPIAEELNSKTLNGKMRRDFEFEQLTTRPISTKAIREVVVNRRVVNDWDISKIREAAAQRNLPVSTVNSQRELASYRIRSSSFQTAQPDKLPSQGSRAWSALKDESGAFRPGNLLHSGAWIFQDGTTAPVGRFVSHAAEARLAGQSETELLKQGAIRVRGSNVEAWAPQYLETSAGQRAREMASGRGEFAVTTSYRNDTAQQAIRRTGFLGDAWASLRDEAGSFTPGNLTGRSNLTGRPAFTTSAPRAEGPLNYKTISWAIHPEHGLVFDPKSASLREHYRWFHEMGLPTAKGEFDKIERGTATLMPRQKKIELQSYQSEFAPNELERALKEAYPETKQYEWSDTSMGVGPGGWPRTNVLGAAWSAFKGAAKEASFALKDETGSFTPGNLTGRALTGESGAFTPSNVTDSVTAGRASVRALRAQLAYRGGGTAAQATADSWEARLSRSLGIPQAPFIPREGGLPPIHAPFDLQNDKIGVEIKTVQETAGDQIFQKGPARARKDAAVSADNIQPFTIAVDTRASKPVYYVKEGYGSFRLGSMNRFDRVSDLKAYLPAYAEGGTVAQTGLAEVHAGEAFVPQADTLKRSVDQLTAQIAAQGQGMRDASRRGKGLAATSAYEGDPEYRTERKEFQQSETDTGARRVSLQSDLDQDEIRKQKAAYEDSKKNNEPELKLFTDRTRIRNLEIAADEKEKAALYQAAAEYAEKLLALDKKYADEKQKDAKADFDNQRRLDDVRTQGTERRFRDTSQRQVRNIEAAAMPGHEGETAYKVEQKQIQAAEMERAFDLAHFERAKEAAEKEFADSAKEATDRHRRTDLLAKIEQDNIKSQDDLYKQIDDARYERQQKLLQLQKQEQERMVNAGVGLIMAAQQGGGKGVTDFVRGELQGLERTVMGNILRMAVQSPQGKQVQQGLHMPGILGDVLAGTPFGKDPAKAGQDGIKDNTAKTADNTDKEAQNTTALNNLTDLLRQLQSWATSPSGGGGSASGTLAGLNTFAGLAGMNGLWVNPSTGTTGAESIGTGDSTAGLTQLPSGLWQRGPAAIPQTAGSTPDVTSNISYGGVVPAGAGGSNDTGSSGGSGSDTGSSGAGVAEPNYVPADMITGGVGLPANDPNAWMRGGGMTVGKGIGMAGAATMGVLGAYQGFKRGGVSGDMSGVGSLASAGAGIAMMAGATGPAAPIVAGVGMALSLIASLLKTGPQQKEADIQKHLQTHQFVAPAALNVSMSSNGGYSDVDMYGNARESNLSPYPQVQQSYADYRHGVTVPSRQLSPFGPTLPAIQQPYPSTSPGGPGGNSNGASNVNFTIHAVDAKGVRDLLVQHGALVADAVARDFSGNQTILNSMRKASVV